MARVVLLTSSAEYRGELDLTGGTGVQIRLLDALNMPARLRFGTGRAEPTLVLDEATRRIRASGVTTPVGPRLVVRPERILAAYEVGEVAEQEALYEKRQETVMERVLIHAVGEVHIDGLVRGGSQQLATIKPERPFVACTQVTLVDQLADTAAITVPFMALNMHLVESYGSAEEE